VQCISGEDAAAAEAEGECVEDFVVADVC
jgi:hypothetical protein